MSKFIHWSMTGLGLDVAEAGLKAGSAIRRQSGNQT
jgi:hypothetical protein